jgi:predicted adenylyl cyclase CyaB
MPTNIEIKARLADFDRTAELAQQLSGAPPQTIPQEDVFFLAPRGRLKLRIFSPQSGELIHYTRPDAEGPKASHYTISPTADPNSLKEVLASACGIRGIVKKVRWLHLAGQTRIHLDRVEGLGDFLELEVVMQEGQPLAEGERIAADLMAKLGIAAADLIEGAYMDLLEQRA